VVSGHPGLATQEPTAWLSATKSIAMQCFSLSRRVSGCPGWVSWPGQSGSCVAGFTAMWDHSVLSNTGERAPP